MNIFILSTSPVEAASLLCDQHVNKMLLESTQLLCTVAHTLYASKRASPPVTCLYKPTHVNHPCTLWLLQSRENCRWLYDHLTQLEAERQHRFDKWTPHQSRLIAAQAWFSLNHPSLQHTDWYSAPATAPAMAMPICYQQFSSAEGLGYDWEDVVLAYKTYYQAKDKMWIQEKGERQAMKWTNRQSPEFFRIITPNAHH